MLSKPDGRRLPISTLRDLLAISRILYRVRSSEGAPQETLDKLETAGKAFAQALELAVLDPYAIGHRAGWNWANEGLKLLGESLYENDASARALVNAAGAVLRAVPRPK